MLNSKIKLYLPVYLIIACLCFIFYWNTLHNPFILDDEGLIIKNSAALSWGYWHQAFTSDLYFGSVGGSNFYRPIQTLSFMWDYHFWRLNPFGYHITNILLQSVVAFLGFLLIFTLSRNKTVAFAASLLFAVNPLHTEAVAYISGRADMLMGMFLLSSLLLFIKSENSQKYIKAGCLALSLLLFALGLLSKELAFVFPFVILAFVFYFKRENFKKPWYKFRVILPFFIIDLVYLILRYTFLKFTTQWVAELAKYPLILRVSVLPEIFFTYLRLLFMPVDLHMSRGLSVHAGVTQIILSWVILAAVIGAIVRILYTSKNKAAYFFFWLFFIFLIPQLGVYPINAFVAEHFVYISSISFFAALIYLLRRYLRKSIFIFSVIFLLFFYGSLTLARNYEWRNPVIFYKQMVKFSPESFLAHNNLGVQYIFAGEYNEAIEEFKQASKLRPDRADAHLNLAKAYIKVKRFKDAENEYGILERITPSNKAAELQNDIAALYEAEGRLDKAQDRYRLALRLDPGLYFVHFNIARLTGDFDKAAKEIMTSLPQTPDAQHADKAVLGMIKGYIKESGNPGCAVTFYNNLGTKLAQAGFYAQAISSFKRVIDLAPEYADAHFNLGLVYWQSGRKREAILEFKTVLIIDPRHYRARAFLSNLNH